MWAFSYPWLLLCLLMEFYWTNFDHLGKDEGIINSASKQSYCSYCYLLYESV